MALASAPHQSILLSSNPKTVWKLFINPHSLPLSNMKAFPVGIAINIEAKLGKGPKIPSPDTEKKWTNHGLITESLPNGMFRVGLVNMVDNKFIRANDDVLLGYVSGKIRTNNIKIVPGDIVRIEISPYDSTKGRVVYRLSRRDMEKLTGSGSKDGYDD